MTAAIVFDPILPGGLIIALATVLGVLTAAVYWRLSGQLSRWQNILLASLRVLGVVLLILLLLQPSELEVIAPVTTSRVTLIGIDNSRSMAQRDVPQGTRLEAAHAFLNDAGALRPDGTPTDEELRLFAFSNAALPVSRTGLVEPIGTTTLLHTSVAGLLGSLRANESARAILLLTDGHDFEAVNPAKTGFLARSRQVPIYAVATGRQGKVRDVAARVTSFLPFCYVKQKARVTATLRTIGCELETLEIDLWRNGVAVQKRQVEVGNDGEVPIAFEVTEPEVGQYEFEIRVHPLSGEADLQNNSAFTYLNVINQQIEVLLLEGAPYWDSAFLQRSLMRNEKLNVDAVIAYGPEKTRVIRKKAGAGEFKVPSSPEAWRRYDLVVLGRDVQKIIGTDGIRQLEEFVKTGGGTVIFSRGRAFGEDGAPSELEPVIWGTKPAEHVRLSAAREGQAIAPFRALAEQQRKDEPLPDLIAVHPIVEIKTLAATLATAQAGSSTDLLPAMIHRPFGNGQVLSIGVDGLWRWAFNAQVEGANTFFDRFWDQTLLWLLAGRDFLPTEKVSLRANSANIPLGEKIYFRAWTREAEARLSETPLVIAQQGKEIGRTTLTAADPQALDRLTAEFLPAKVGKYEATAQFPGGLRTTARFFVFEDNPEQTEVVTDSNYLRRLCEASGGRLLAPDELGKFFAELKTGVVATAPATRLRSVWDRAWVFWTLGLLFAVDWYLRRRWGLQ